MNLFDLANELDLGPKKASCSEKAEYHSRCPECGGKDRFIFWLEQNRYWCRQCNKKGDAIQFCRDFQGMDYRSACEKVGSLPKDPLFYPCKPIARHKFCPQAAITPSDTWREKAQEFVSLSHEKLLKDETAKQLLRDRGFSLSSMQKFHLGWNPTTYSVPLNEWGLPISFKSDGKERSLWLPKGIIIPFVLNGDIFKLKIRRSDWHLDDVFPKYLEVSGSMKCPAICGNTNAATILLVESELDAMLVEEHAPDLCLYMAIGGAGKRPDLNSDRLLRKAERILCALDFDEAGQKAYTFWRSTYENLIPWPVPKGKGPGDAFKEGFNLVRWIEAGIKINRRLEDV